MSFLFGSPKPPAPPPPPPTPPTMADPTVLQAGNAARMAAAMAGGQSGFGGTIKSGGQLGSGVPAAAMPALQPALLGG